jgi:hypothetical protein
MRAGTLFLWLCWASGLLHPFSGAAQTKDFNFRQISLGEGLSQSSVFAIVQDDDGFMWFGTQDGLNQYDGYRFNVYKKRAFDTTSLSHSHIRALLKDQLGNLWIGTAYGLNRLDRKTKRFINVSYLLGKKSEAEQRPEPAGQRPARKIPGPSEILLSQRSQQPAAGLSVRRKIRIGPGAGSFREAVDRYRQWFVPGQSGIRRSARALYPGGRKPEGEP